MNKLEVYFIAMSEWEAAYDRIYRLCKVDSDVMDVYHWLKKGYGDVFADGWLEYCNEDKEN